MTNPNPNNGRKCNTGCWWPAVLALTIFPLLFVRVSMRPLMAGVRRRSKRFSQL